MKLKFLNLWREPVPISRQDTAHKYLPYGPHDNYPLILATKVAGSVIASSCISTKADFIEGEGFNDEEWNDLVINPRGEKLSELNRNIAESQSQFYGYYVRIVYGKGGDPVAFYFLPFENCRMGIPDDDGYISKILYNPNFGTKHYRTQDTISYDVFTPSKDTVLKQIKEQGPEYKGQVFFWGTTSPLDRIYPRPDYYESSQRWMEVDFRIGQYHEMNLKNGFLQPVIMTIIGDPTAMSQDPVYEGKTVGEVFDIEMSENFAGTHRVGGILVQWVRNKEEASTLAQFPGNNQEGYMNSLVDRMRELITAATKVPGILANINQGAQLGGDGNTIRAATKLMQQRSAKWHHVNERNYQTLFDRYEPATQIGAPIKIVHYNPFPELSTVDPLVWETLTPEEKRKWVRDNTEVDLQDPTPIPLQVPTDVFRNFSYSSYPDKAKQSAVKAKQFMETTGAKCVSPAGKEIMEDIIAGRPLSFERIKRLHKYLKKNEAFKNSPFTTDNCYAVQYQSWGGLSMFSWCDEKINEIMK